MRSHVEEHEPGDILDLLAGEAKSLHARTGHPGPDDLVVVERDAARRELPGGRLADVVEQRGEPEVEGRRDLLDNGDRVSQHVLVVMQRVLLEGQRRQFRQEMVGQSGLDQFPQRPGNVGPHHQLGELLSNALRRNDLEALAHPPHRRPGLGLYGEAERGDEPVEAQHPKRVVTEGDLGIHRRAQQARPQIAETSVGIDDVRAVGGLERDLDRHRIDREVAARQILSDLIGERDPRLPAVVGVHLGAESRDLVNGAAANGGHSSELLARQVEVVGPFRDDLLDGFRPGVRGEVEVRVIPTHQCVTHRPHRRGRGGDRLRQTAWRGAPASSLR